METLFKHFWLAFIVVTVVNGRSWWLGVQDRIRAQPELSLVVWNVAIGAFTIVLSPPPGGAPRHVPEAAEWTWALLPFFFVAMWCFVSIVLASIGGWSVLARDYLAGSAGFHGRSFTFRSVQLGSVSYGACLTLGVNAEGLRISILPMFRVAHPPLFVPWGDVTARATSGRSVSLPKQAHLTLEHSRCRRGDQGRKQRTTFSVMLW